MIGFIKDLDNYLFVRKCFNLVIENEVLAKKYQPKLTFLGVLYYYFKIQKSAPEDYHTEHIVNHMEPIDSALTAMNLDGIVDVDYRPISEDENFKIYLIKFYPIFTYVNFWYILRWSVTWYLIIHFEVFQFCYKFLKPYFLQLFDFVGSKM